jgi:peptidoglycan/xylan/chitin deacetylase (PgdA/CDA1 family)
VTRPAVAIPPVGAWRYHAVMRAPPILAAVTLLGMILAAACDQIDAAKIVGQPIGGDAVSVVTQTDATPAESSQAPVERLHVVARGETVHAIAAQYGTTVAALVYVNSLRGSYLEPGRELTIPEGDPRPPPPAEESFAAAVVVDRGSSARRSVALTFDAGADRGYAELILNTLRDAGIRASFGMTGSWASQNPDLVQRMAAEGHRFINHTWDHGSFTGLSTNTRPLTREQLWSQLDRTEALLIELTGQSSRPFFRSPYGDLDASVQRDIAARGYAYNVLWTIDSGGWRGIPARSIVDICLRNARPGAIYVMHVGASAQDGPALPAIIEGLRAAGYDFETIDEILG